jgi:ABC-type lipoprotein release transport system permease subunit
LSDSLIGLFFGIFVGFGIGVGSTLAVMYSIYMGGYRKAVQESLLAVQPPRYLKALENARSHILAK